MNYKEILTQLEQLEIIPQNLGDEDYDEKKVESAVGKIKEVESVGGGEGGGETVVRVYHFVDHDIYIKIGGYYASYEGTTWDEEFTEVRPKKKTITVYE